MGTTYYQITKNETGEWTKASTITYNYEAPLDWVYMYPDQDGNNHPELDALVGEGNLMLPDDWLDEMDLTEFCNRYVEEFPERLGVYLCWGKYPSYPFDD